MKLPAIHLTCCPLCGAFYLWTDEEGPRWRCSHMEAYGHYVDCVWKNIIRPTEETIRILEEKGRRRAESNG